MTECAKALGKHATTIAIIARSDMFKEYFARRREEWTRMHDFALIHKTTRVAEAALDLMAEKLTKQGDKIPMNLLTEVATGTLDRLGYAPKSTPPVEVNISNDNRKVVMVPIDAGALQEARDAIRAAEARRSIEHREAASEASGAATTSPSIDDLELEAEPKAPGDGDDQSPAPPHRS
jgi:hypothetical protein